MRHSIVDLLLKPFTLDVPQFVLHGDDLLNRHSSRLHQLI